MKESDYAQAGDIARLNMIRAIISNIMDRTPTIRNLAVEIEREIERRYLKLDLESDQFPVEK